VSPDGQLAIELVAQFDQDDPDSEGDPDYGGVPVRGGATVIGAADGTVRYVIAKPMSDDRRHRQKDYVSELDRTDFAMAWNDDGYDANRMRARTSFAALHRGL
jgi:hypothetical protein